MALSIGQAMGLDGFSETQIGTYDAGAFDHRFHTREALPMTESQRIAIVQAGTAAGMALATAMRRAGYQDDDVAQALADLSEERRRNLNEARAYLETQRAIDGAGVYDTDGVTGNGVTGYGPTATSRRDVASDDGEEDD
jgi:hypothetical protein